MSKITKEDICTDVFGFNLGNKPVLRIPTGITKIGKETFAGNETIEVLILSDTVEVIGKSAFENCRNLAAVISLQGSRLRKIDKRAFANSGLLIANFPYQVKISDTAFEGCQNLDGLFNV
ncbi:MAG: leucine-rich repeat domain-containing protein [Clostridiales bacterium]|nr:leucine-rich repeat domain-containing protein [Clostridiales bacterium]